MPKIKKIAKAQLNSAVILKPAEMNKIHFGGQGTVIKK